MPSARRSAGPSAPKLGGGTVTLERGAFEAPFNMPVVHEAVRAELAARRHGTASTKTRGQVRGGGAKPWRQKGTGRARQGSIRAPHFTGGGTAFGPTPRRYTFKVNRKERRAALRSALSLHAGRGSLAVFDASLFDVPATARAASLLSDWGAPTPTLVILTDGEAEAGKSFRNLRHAVALPVEDAGVADIVGAASLLVSEAALPTLVARAAKPERVGARDGDERDAKAPNMEANRSRSGEPAAESEPEAAREAE